MTGNATPKNRIETPTVLKWVPLTLMQIRPESQRELNRAWADHIATDIDIEKLGTFVVNKVGTVFWLIDGQHRREALIAADWGDQQVQCQVFENLTPQQEAELFLGLNDRRPIPAIQDFRIAVFAGRERECEIDRIVREQGCAVASTKIDGAIRAVGTLIRIYERSSGKVLGRAIAIARDAYGSTGLESFILDGLSLVCGRYNGDLEDQLAIVKLRNLQGGAGGLMGRAYHNREMYRKSLAECVAAAAVDVINGGRGGKKLPSWWREDAA